MKKKSTYILGLLLILLVSSTLCACNKKEAKEKNVQNIGIVVENYLDENITEEEKEELAETTHKEMLIIVNNNCEVDIPMFSVIDPLSEEQVNLTPIEAGSYFTAKVLWPTDVEDLQWAIYNANGDLYIDNVTTVKDATESVTITLEGTDAIDNVETEIK